MSRFVDTTTKVQFVVDDSKDYRYPPPRYEKSGDEKKPARKSTKSES